MTSSLTRTWLRRIAAYDAGQPIEKAKIQAFRKLAVRPPRLPELDEKLLDALEKLFDRGFAWAITPEQTEQGLRWLKLPKIYRQLGDAEQAILNDFSHFRLVDVDDRSTCFRMDSGPVYRVCSHAGPWFDYTPRPWQAGGCPFEIIQTRG